MSLLKKRITNITNQSARLFAAFVAIFCLSVGFTLATSSHSVAVAQQYGQTIQNIQVRGNQRIEVETVRSYLAVQPGQRFTAEGADQSVKALFETGLFSDVRMGMTGGTLVIEVDENPVINRVAFEGNKEVDDATLNGEVQLKTRAIYTRARVQADVQRILDVYQARGIYSAKVEPNIIKLDHNRVDLVYEITEGSETKVKSINFVGNEAFDDGDLKDVITTGESGFFSFLQSNNIYDPERLSVDRELIRRHYMKNGYADVRVLSAIADLDAEGTGFYVTFTIDEGPIYRFGHVDVQSSLSSVDPVALQPQALTVPGQIYNGELIGKTVEKLTLSIAEQGYAFAKITPRIQRDPETQTIGISYVVEEGPRVYIDRINIYGNTRTRDYVIRREFKLAEGDAYNSLMVNRAKERLQRLGFFEKVNISRERGIAADRVILNVSVVEKNTGELQFGAGYSSSEGVIGDISVTERNLLGKGQYLRLKLSGSVERFQVDLSFTEPRFLDQNLSAGFDLFHKEIDRSDESDYKNRKTGGGLRLGFPVTENSWFSANYRFVRDQIFDVEDDAPLAIQELDVDGDGEEIRYISSLGYRFTYDTRNSRRKPTRGIYASISQDLAGLGGDVNYLKTQADLRAYYPLWNKVTLVGRLVGGHIMGWGGDDVSIIDNFYKGGELVRGFDRAGLGPRQDGKAIGGKTYYGGTVEVRFPIPYLTDAIGMTGAVFADAGAVYGYDSSVTGIDDSKNLRSSVGGSVLWDSPVGPIRADLAYILSSEDFDDEEVFRFGASTNF